MDFSYKYVLHLLDKFDEYDIGNLEKLEPIEEKIKSNQKLTDEEIKYIREKHEQLIALSEDEAKTSRGLEAVSKLRKAEIGNSKRFDKIQETFEAGLPLEKIDNDYLQDKLGQLEKITEYHTDEDDVDSASIQISRPTGITILGILYILGGIGGIIAAIAFGVMSSMMDSTIPMMGGFTVIGGMVALVFAGIAVLGFVIAGCLLSGKSWARKIVIVFVVIDLVLEFVSMFGGNFFGVAMIILDLFVLYYLYRPHVIDYFER